MKQLVSLGPKQNILKEVPMPEFRTPTQVLIRVHYCGVCMSEHYDWATAPAGRSFGHEPVGVVEQVAPAVTRVKPGDRVSGLFPGNAEFVLAEEEAVFLLPDHVKDEEAMLEPLSCLISAVSKVRVPVIGETVAVVGCGYMGCGAISLLKLRGARVVGVDIRPESLQNALTYGADEVYTPDQLPAEYREIHGVSAPGSGFPLVMEWGETEDSLDLAIQMTRMCGQLAIGAYHTGGKRLVDVQQLNVKAIDCLSTHPREHEFNLKCCESAVQLLTEGNWSFQHVPTKIYPVTQFDRAQAELPKKFGKYLKAAVDFTQTSGEAYLLG